MFSISKGEVIRSMRLTRKHNIARNDPFFAVEAFENLIEFHSVALPKNFLSYELALEEKLITFAEACDYEDIEETRAFLMVIEREEELWVRKVVMSHDKLLGEEEIGAEDLFNFDKPAEPIDHAVFVEEKLYLKLQSQILVANEGVVEFPKGLKFLSNLVYSKDDGLKCLGELEGVTQDVDVLNKIVTPDPNASGIGFFFGTAAKVYPDSVDFSTPN